MTLSPPTIDVTNTSTAAPPSAPPPGWTGGTFASDNPAVALVSGNTIRAAGHGGGTMIRGSGWTAPNGATGCALAPARITVRDFEVEASPRTITTPPVIPAVYSVTVSADSGFAGSVALSQVGAPTTPGPVTLTPSSSGVPPYTTFLHIPITAATPPGTYRIIITGTYNGHQHTAEVELIVGSGPSCPAPPPAVSLSPSSIPVGGTATITPPPSPPWSSSMTFSASPSTAVDISGTTITGRVAGSAMITGLGTYTSGSGSLPCSLGPTRIEVTRAPEEGPRLSVSPTSFTFSAMEGGSNPTSQRLIITNTGGGRLDWSVSGGPSWSSVRPSSGSEGPGRSSTLEVSVNISDLTAGTYTGSITVSAPGAVGSPQELSVRLIVSPVGSRTLFPPTLSLVRKECRDDGRQLAVELSYSENRDSGRGETADQIFLYRNHGAGPVYVESFRNPGGIIAGRYTDVVSPPPPLLPRYTYTARSVKGVSFSLPSGPVAVDHTCSSSSSGPTVVLNSITILETRRGLEDTLVLDPNDRRNGDRVKLQLSFRNTGDREATSINSITVFPTANLFYQADTLGCEEGRRTCPVTGSSPNLSSLQFTTTALPAGASFNATLWATIRTRTTQPRETVKVQSSGTYRPGTGIFGPKELQFLVKPDNPKFPSFIEVGP